MSVPAHPATPAQPEAAARRRGRRPAGEDTRQAIIEVARSEFAARGYDGTTLRGVARAAGVDARLVHHYFDGKEDLFVAAMDLPVRPQEVLPLILGPGPEGVGERVVRFFFAVWDPPAGRERILAIIGAALNSPEAARMMREFLARELFGRIAHSLGGEQADLRAGLVAAQMVGLAMARYVVRIEPLASAPVDDLMPWLAPTIQRYLVG
ncbi:MAG TPA: TetR family transcriptional regulator [Streptosporangiaceae bacterium]|nr:TetR family transcriptional regulator [Streptosporangiaceae bacterium]